MVRHGFVDRPCAGVADAAAHTVAIQAQDLTQARLGIRARSAGPTDADVGAAITDRTVVRTWLMRNTIHLVAAEDLLWLVALIGPVLLRRLAKRWNDLGLTPPVLAKIERVASALLADGPLTRHELAAALNERRIRVDVEADRQTATHVLVYLASVGLTCHTDGPEFALLDQWLPDAPAGPRGDDALAEIARRYFRAFSPATAADFTTWSGLPSGQAIALIRDELSPADVGGRAGWRLGPAVDGHGVRLLSGFDNYLVGYKHRTELISPDAYPDVYVGGIIRPAVVHDGRIVGRWRLDRQAGRVAIGLYGRVAASVRPAIAAEVEDLARFVGKPLTREWISVGT